MNKDFFSQDSPQETLKPLVRLAPPQKHQHD
jgi:hypothetical protein